MYCTSFEWNTAGWRLFWDGQNRIKICRYRQMPMSRCPSPTLIANATFAPAAQEKLAFSQEDLLLPGPGYRYHQSVSCASFPRLHDDEIPNSRYFRGESKAGTAYYTLEPLSKLSGCFYEQNSQHICRQDVSQTYFLTSCHRGEGLSESSEAGGLKTGASLSADAPLATINFSISVESSSSREARARIVYAVTTSEPTRRRHPSASVTNFIAYTCTDASLAQSFIFY